MPISKLDHHFLDKFKTLIQQTLGIYFAPAKLEMLQARIDRVMRHHGVDSYDLFYELLTKRVDRKYWSEFVDEVTIHQSSFFRENNHFEYIRSQLRPILENNQRIIRNNEIKVWSAGCSTGEEPYTLAMVLKEWLPQEIAIKILATDISHRTLALAQAGEYQLPRNKKEMDQYYLKEYFDRKDDCYEIKPFLKELVSFRQFNLMDSFSFKDSFDMIFCRNVMIYFNVEVQQNLVNKFSSVLAPGGLFFIGHSETLFNKTHRLEYVQPAIYMKPGMQ